MLSNRPSIKVIQGQPVSNKNSLRRHDHTSRQAPQYHHHWYPWSLSQKEFDIVDTRSNMHLDDLNSKTHGGQILIYLIDSAIVACFYPPQGSEHHTLLCLDNFHGPNHDQEKLSEEPDKKWECV